MTLRVNLDALYEAVERMGVTIGDSYPINLGYLPDEPIDIELGNGIKVDLKNVESKNGLLTHRGRQILLYIQDLRWKDKIDKALKDGSEGNKFHVSDCYKLREMRKWGKKERYVITNALSKEFFISGINTITDEKAEGYTCLKVCKFCLSELNYKGYASSWNDGKKIFDQFTQEEFFATYSSFFPYRPTRFAGPMSSDDYSHNWNTISKNHRKAHDYICEECSLDLSDHKQLLHVHHVNGQKKDNRPSNLKALCVECHRKQPCHGHMYVDPQAMRKIIRLRREQGMLEAETWEEVAEMVNSGIEGLVHKCDSSLPVPKVNHEILGGDGSVVAEVDLAWPSCRFGIAIHKKDIVAAGQAGWEIWEGQKAIDDFAAFSEKIRCGK